jgi:hypothetical protein
MIILGVAVTGTDGTTSTRTRTNDDKPDQPLHARFKHSNRNSKSMKEWPDKMVLTSFHLFFLTPVKCAGVSNVLSFNK